MKPHPSPFINHQNNTIEFHVKLKAASEICLSGSFNHWARDQYKMKHVKGDNWQVEIPLLPKGKYYYRFCIDNRMEMEDIENPLREPDGVVGFYSVLKV
ncbi:MAG: hypothetical protein EOO04_03595 [Chitinophagaceae bacterium]|nr:MAG: hypothetical protein EOO04_03595 [Chitinophagaceae bacterium]